MDFQPAGRVSEVLDSMPLLQKLDSGVAEVDEQVAWLSYCRYASGSSMLRVGDGGGCVVTSRRFMSLSWMTLCDKAVQYALPELSNDATALSEAVDVVAELVLRI